MGAGTSRLDLEGRLHHAGLSMLRHKAHLETAGGIGISPWDFYICVWAVEPCHATSIIDHALCSIFPNCSAKAKGEKQTLIADQLAETNEISQLVLRRPMDRVSD